MPSKRAIIIEPSAKVYWKSNECDMEAKVFSEKGKYLNTFRIRASIYDASAPKEDDLAQKLAQIKDSELGELAYQLYEEGSPSGETFPLGKLIAFQRIDSANRENSLSFTEEDFYQESLFLTKHPEILRGMLTAAVTQLKRNRDSFAKGQLVWRPWKRSYQFVFAYANTLYVDDGMYIPVFQKAGFAMRFLEDERHHYSCDPIVMAAFCS